MSQLQNKLGRLLHLERQRLELKLEDLADELKISAEYLEAIEQGAIEKLPTDLYFNLFAKSYAERLGIDYARTVDAISADLDETEENESKVSSDSDKTGSKESDKSDEEKNNSAFGKKLIQLVVAVVVLFAITLTVYIWFFKTEESANNVTNEMTATKAVATEPDKEIDFDSHEWNLDEASAPAPMNLHVVARQESWASIYVDGKSGVRRNLVPWVEYKLEAKYRFKVSIGIPSRVEVKLNGTVINLIDPATRRITGVEINQLNLDKWLSGETKSVPTRSAVITTPAEIEPTISKSDHSEQNKNLPASSADPETADENQTTTPVDSGGEPRGL